jgi:hypothetical protein
MSCSKTFRSYSTKNRLLKRSASLSLLSGDGDAKGAAHDSSAVSVAFGTTPAS